MYICIFTVSSLFRGIKYIKKKMFLTSSYLYPICFIELYLLIDFEAFFIDKWTSLADQTNLTNLKYIDRYSLPRISPTFSYFLPFRLAILPT